MADARQDLAITATRAMHLESQVGQRGRLTVLTPNK